MYIRFSFFLLLGCLLSQKTAFAEILTFSKALELAQNASLNLKQPELQMLLLKLDQNLLHRSAWPNVSTSIGYKRNLWHETPTEEKKNLSADLSLTYQIIDFGRQSARSDEKKDAIEAQASKMEEIKQQLIWDLGRFYSQAIVAVKYFAVTKKQLEVAQFKEKETQRQFRSGIRPELDVVAAQVERGKAEVKLQKAEDRKAAAMRQLCLLTHLGKEESCQAAVQYELPSSLAEVTVPEKVINIASAWPFSASVAEKTRDIQRQQLDASRKEIDAEQWPTVNTSLVLLHTTGTRDAHKGTNQTFATLGIDWDIPWRGMNRIENEKISQQLAINDFSAQLELSHRRAKEQVALNDLKNFQREWDLLNTQKRLLELERSLIKKKYDNGKATVLELNQAESELIALEQEIVTLSGQSFITAVELAQSRGVTAIEKLFEGS